MNLSISDCPSSYLVVKLQQSEQIITEKGTLIYANGKYDFQNKFEAKSYKNWLAKLIGGKSLSYNIYTASEEVDLAFAPKDTSELFSIQASEDSPILFEPDLHFARTVGLGIHLAKQDWKSTLNDGIKVRTEGSGELILKGYGKIIRQEIDSDKPVLIDEEALIAFEESLEVSTVSTSLKETITSGEGFLFSIKGKGIIWLQTRVKSKPNNGGSAVDGVFSFLK